LLSARLPATLELVGLAFVIAWTIALSTALILTSLGTSRASSWLRTTVSATVSLIATMPVGMVALAALLVAPVTWLVSLSGKPGIGGLPWLAAAVLGIGMIPAVYFTALNGLAGVMPRAFILGAQARGLSSIRILLRHALPNTSDLLFPLASVTLTQLVLEAVIVETLLAWPGIGQLSITAAAQRDIPLVSALVLISGLLVIVANAGSELLQLWTNPTLQHA
jgi:peptide/nickel transport system permease protein